MCDACAPFVAAPFYPPVAVNTPVAQAPRSPALHVLAVDDDPQVRQMIRDYLAENDIRVTALASGAGIDEVMQRDAIDLLILDLKMPGEDGMVITQRLRTHLDIPIIVLTGRREEADRVMGLELGADDYLTKPFSPRELLARIRALIRRSRTAGNNGNSLSRVRAYRFADWELSVRLRRLRAPDGATISLTNNEFNLLVAFLTAPGQVHSREQLLNRSRLYGDEVYDRSIDVLVGRLRRKLEREKSIQRLIVTERGVGYLIDTAVEVVH